MHGAAGRCRQTGAAPSRCIGARLATAGVRVCGLGIVSGTLVMAPRQAVAFPASDVTSPSIVAPASAATSDQSDASALAHQLNLLNGYSGIVAPGWNFTSSLGLQETLNDNIFQSSTNRRWDIISGLTPGVAAYGDTARVQLRLNYQPTIEYYARDTSLNQIAQSLNATSDITIWPDHLYLDLRATSGVASTSGSSPGLGYGANTSGTTGTALTGQTKANSTQYTSYAASPYFLQSFDAYGTLKVGYTYSQSTSSNTGAVLPIPLNTGGSSASETSSQEFIQFSTGSFLERITDTVAVNATQSLSTNATAATGTGLTSTGATGTGTTSTGTTAAGTGSSQGSSTTFSNQVNYVLNRSITVFASIGYEDITYGGTNAVAIHDMTWQIGTTLTPNPRSTLNLSYGHSQGVDSLSASGFYQLTPRTSVNVSYGESLATQLQTVAQQLSQTAINNSGVAVNSQTGAPLYNSTNLLGTQNELSRTTTATIGTATQLDRDTISFNAQYAVSTAAGAGASSSTSGITGTAGWTHSIRDNLTLSTSASYGIHTLNPGRTAYTALSSSLSYTLSRTVSASLSYSFYDLTPSGSGANSTGQGGSVYQDIFILSLTKQF